MKRTVEERRLPRSLQAVEKKTVSLPHLSPPKRAFVPRFVSQLTSRKTKLFETSSENAYSNPVSKTRHKKGNRIFGSYRGVESSFSESILRSGLFRDYSLDSLRRQKLSAIQRAEQLRAKSERYAELRRVLQMKRESSLRCRREQRKRERRESAAARKIQVVANRFIRSRREQNLKERMRKQNIAAVLLQSAMRVFLAKAYVRRRRLVANAASIKLCDFFRTARAQTVAKKELCRLREKRKRRRAEVVKIFYDSHACVIQRRVRGKFARERVGRIKSERALEQKRKKEALETRRQKAMKRAEEAARKLRGARKSPSPIPKRGH